jgi:hypothetical protein
VAVNVASGVRCALRTFIEQRESVGTADIHSILQTRGKSLTQTQLRRKNVTPILRLRHRGKEGKPDR